MSPRSSPGCYIAMTRHVITFSFLETQGQYRYYIAMTRCLEGPTYDAKGSLEVQRRYLVLQYIVTHLADQSMDVNCMYTCIQDRDHWNNSVIHHVDWYRTHQKQMVLEISPTLTTASHQIYKIRLDILCLS